MKRHSHPKGGFTLVEILISIGLMLVFLPFAASMLISTQLLASYSKHKIQAAYAAKQIIETARQAAVLNGTLASQAATPVILDTKGNYAQTCATGYFCGTSTVTVSATVYTNSVGAQTTNNNIDHVVVQISWPEQIFTAQQTMTETYATDIILNDDMLN